MPPLSKTKPHLRPYRLYFILFTLEIMELTLESWHIVDSTFILITLKNKPSFSKFVNSSTLSQKKKKREIKIEESSKRLFKSHETPQSATELEISRVHGRRRMREEMMQISSHGNYIIQKTWGREQDLAVSNDSFRKQKRLSCCVLLIQL